MEPPMGRHSVVIRRRDLNEQARRRLDRQEAVFVSNGSGRYQVAGRGLRAERGEDVRCDLLSEVLEVRSRSHDAPAKSILNASEVLYLPQPTFHPSFP